MFTCLMETESWFG